MAAVFTSDRLLFSEFQPGDGHLVYLLNSDPDVTRYLHEPVTEQDKAEEILSTIIIPQYRLYNHGRWAVHLKTTNEFIGWCGLKYRPELNQIDLGYRFMQRHWGKGYATEAALATIKYGFEVLGLTEIFAAAHIENIASQRVLEKAGMIYTGEALIDDCPTMCYVLKKPQN